METVQSGELSFGSDPQKNAYSGRKLRASNHWVEWSHPCPHLFISTSWVTDGRTYWPKMLRRRRGERGAKIYWMKTKACLFIWGRSGSNFFSLIADKCALRQHLDSFKWLSYAILAFGMFVYEACEMDSVRLCGGRWWGYRRMWDELGKWEQAVRLAVFCMCAVWDCCRMISILLLFTFQVLKEMNRWDGTNRLLMSPAAAKVVFSEFK